MNNKCSGCSACSVICPTDSIEMKLNRDGFIRPYINQKKCINCKLCEKICIFNQEDRGKFLDDANLYSAWTKNFTIRETTTSGGIGYEISKWALSKGYSVCGVEFSYKKMRAQHSICKNTEEIEKLKGSKYLQSDCQYAIKQLIKILMDDSKKKAVFFGTPCQVAGLHNILIKKKLRARVILIDIFCHGVPTFNLWKNYLIWLENKKKIKKTEIKKLIFRDKKYSWHTYYMHITCDNDKEYICSRKKDPFLKLFSMGTLNQKECFTCMYRNNSFADIRLGDFWGKRYQESEKGYSMVLTLSEIGEKIISSLKNIEKENIPIEERLGQQHNDYMLPDNYKKGFQLLDEDVDLQSIVNYYDPVLKRMIRECKQTIKKILRK